MKRTRKGFTLVELLIVVAIVGVLAAMMTLANSGATSSAAAAKIATGFKVIRSAAAMYVMDSRDEATPDYFNAHSTDYVGPESKTLLYKYTLESVDATNWSVSYTFKEPGSKDIVVKFAKTSKDLSMTGTANSAKMRIY